MMMMFLRCLAIFSMRVNLSVALVAMVNETSHMTAPNITDAQQCQVHPPNITKPYQEITPKKLAWGGTMQGISLGAVYLGIVMTQMPGRLVAERFGAKNLLGLAVFVGAFLTLITPSAAQVSPYLLICVRILIGACEGVTQPGTQTLMSRWCPPDERKWMSTFIITGNWIGAALCLFLSGIICENLGWDWAFYVFGIASCIWFFGWMTLMHDSPNHHPSITRAEKKYIYQSMGTSNFYDVVMPWRDALRSVPCWAVLVAEFCNNWGIYTFLTCLPIYMKELLHYDIPKSGLFSAIPFLSLAVVMNLGAHVADSMRKNKILSITNIRKIFNTLGLCLPAAAMVTVGYIGCDTHLIIIMLTLGLGSSGLIMSGFGVNHLDLAPSFAGNLQAWSSSVSTIPCIAAPEIVEYLTYEKPTIEQWRVVFLLTAAVYIFGAVFFLVFGSGEVQTWAKVPELRRKERPASRPSSYGSYCPSHRVSLESNFRISQDSSYRISVERKSDLFEYLLDYDSGMASSSSRASGSRASGSRASQDRSSERKSDIFVSPVIEVDVSTNL